MTAPIFNPATAIMVHLVPGPIGFETHLRWKACGGFRECEHGYHRWSTRTVFDVLKIRGKPRRPTPTG